MFHNEKFLEIANRSLGQRWKIKMGLLEMKNTMIKTANVLAPQLKEKTRLFLWTLSYISFPANQKTITEMKEWSGKFILTYTI